jgi:hypothetical protein
VSGFGAGAGIALYVHPPYGFGASLSFRQWGLASTAEKGGFLDPTDGKKERPRTHRVGEHTVQSQPQPQTQTQRI